MSFEVLQVLERTFMGKEQILRPRSYLALDGFLAGSIGVLARTFGWIWMDPLADVIGLASWPAGCAA